MIDGYGFRIEAQGGPLLWYRVTLVWRPDAYAYTYHVGSRLGLRWAAHLGRATVRQELARQMRKRARQRRVDQEFPPT